MMDRNYDKQYVTTVGVAKFPYLVKPDTKFDDRGLFKTDLILSKEDIQPIEDSAMELAKAFKASDVKNHPARKGWDYHIPILEDLDQDGNETGMGIARFKQAAAIRTRDGREIKKSILLFDSQGNRLTDVNPYSGTRMAVAYTMSPYANPTGKRYGVTFRLVAAQIIDLVEGTGASADTMGFKKVDGFVKESPTNDESLSEQIPASEEAPLSKEEEESLETIDF